MAAGVWRRFVERALGCRHAGLILPLRYHVLEGGIVIELGRCERCGARIAR